LNFNVQFDAFCGAFWRRTTNDNTSFHSQELKWRPFDDLVYSMELTQPQRKINVLRCYRLRWGTLSWWRLACCTRRRAAPYNNNNNYYYYYYYY